MPANDMQALVGRTELLVTAISDAILSAAEAAAERVELAATVARVQQRLGAFTAVLEAVAVQKRALVERLAVADGPSKALIHRQIELLGLQEIAVLERAGVPQPAVQQALAAMDTPPVTDASATHRRDGRRFVRLAAGTGTEGHGNSTHPTDAKEGRDET